MYFLFTIYTENKDTTDSNLQKLPISNDILHKLQQEDVFCKIILNQIEKGNIIVDSYT